TRGPKPSEYVSTRIPIRRASTRCPASWAAISRPRPTMATRMAMKRGSIADQCLRCAKYSGADMRRRILGAAVALAACAEHHTLTRVDASGLSRLDEQQMQPVDDARVDEGRAQDAVAKAKAAEADARARLEVAKSEKDVSEAQLKRSIAERDLLKKQYAPKDQVAQAEENIEAAQDLVKATEFKLAYL